MTADEIAKMDYKQLRNTVIELNDNYIKLKRMLDDTLNNLDASNLATTFRKEIDGYKSEFKITAKEISSKVEHIEEGLEQYSTIKQTADKIEMAVNENREYTDGQTQELSSKFSMTAGQISTNVTKVNNKVDSNYTELYSSITQTAENIVTEVGRTYNKSNYFDSTTLPPRKSAEGYDEDKLCKYKDNWYYYNTITKTWNPYNEEVKSAMTQTKDGFVFNGDVDISKSTFIGDTLTIADRNKGTTGADRAFEIMVDSGTVYLVGRNGRDMYLNCNGQFTVAVGNNNRLIIQDNKLYWNGKRVLTTDDLSERGDG